MNKNRLNQIVQVLLLPYCGNNFWKEDGDVLKNLRQSLYQYLLSVSESIDKRIKAEKNYGKKLNEMEEFIRSDIHLRTQSVDDIKLLIELFYPEEDILTKMESCGDAMAGIENFYFFNLFRIANSLLTFRDGKIAIRTWINKEKEELFQGQDVFDKVEIWNLLCRKMVPDVFIAAFYISSGMEDARFLYNQNGGITLADKVLDKILKKGLAETHMHMNAGTEYVVLWEQITRYSYWRDKIRSETVFQKKEQKYVLQFFMFVFRVLFAAFIKNRERYKCFEDYISKNFSGKSEKLIFKILYAMYKGEPLQYDKNYEDLLKEIKALYASDFIGFDENQDFLFQTIFRKEKAYKTYSELIFLFESLIYLQRNMEDGYAMHLFIQYLRAKNLYFSQIMQNGYIEGLSNFKKYYSAAAAETWRLGKATKRNAWSIIFKGQSNNINLKKIEIRIAPDILMDYTSESQNRTKYRIKKDILQKIRNVFEAYIEYVKDIVYENTEGVPGTEADRMFAMEQCSFPSIGVIFHFLKVEYLDNRIGNMCWLQYQENESVFSKHVLIWRKKMVEYVRCLEELRSSVPYLAEYLVGIDAASEENCTEPWIMAPVYQAVRNKQITKAIVQDEGLQFRRVVNLGFTYHVGEEFRHILSGLRHIDEVLEEFNYKAGDRLGHAIALGTDIENWVRQNEVIAVPALEWMENLLWIWGNVVQDKIKIEVSATYLEGKILELAKDIYGNIQGMTPLMLYDAYKNMFHMNYNSIFDKQKKCMVDYMKNPLQTNSNSFFCKYFDSSLGTGWSKEKVICTFFCPTYNMRFRRPILIRTSENLGIEVLEKIQKSLIRKVEYLGVYVETNPTSNTAIGSNQGLLSHHILKLNSEGLLDGAEKTNAVMVTVNTDDPIVFNTNIENELSYIYYALVHKKYKKERILHWIDKIRQNSMDSSFIKEVKKPSRQLEEMNIIIKYIEKFLKNEK